MHGGRIHQQAVNLLVKRREDKEGSGEILSVTVEFVQKKKN